MFVTSNDASGVVIDCSLSLNCHNLLDVSGIYFCDSTFMGSGNSFDISTNHTFHVKAPSFAMGFALDASGTGSFAVGNGCITAGDYSVAMGFDCSAGGIASFADGSGCIAAGNYSVAMGQSNTTSGEGAVAMGLSNTAATNYAVAMGIV